MQDVIFDEPAKRFQAALSVVQLGQVGGSLVFSLKTSA